MSEAASAPGQDVEPQADLSVLLPDETEPPPPGKAPVAETTSASVVRSEVTGHRLVGRLHE